MRKIAWKKIKKYSDYIGDSYTHARIGINQKDLEGIWDCFFKINQLIEESNKRFRIRPK
jgi:hypothetical protein